MATGNAEVVGLELERVLPNVATLFERDDVFFTSIKKRNVEKISNRQMRIPLEMSPGGNFGYFDPDGGDLGRGSSQQWDKAVLQAVFMKEGIEYTKLAEWGTDDSRKAVQNAVRQMVAKAMDELRRQIESQLQQPGTGVVGLITSVTTSGGVDTYVLQSDGFGAKLVRFNQVIQVFDTTLATNRGSGVITSYDIQANTISVTPAITNAAATDKLVVSGITTPTAIPALYGVPYHDSNASTGTWLGFSRATTPQVRASRVNGNNSPLTLPSPRLAINNIGNRVGIDNNFNPVAWMHPAQKQAYEEIGQLVSMIWKEPKEEKLNLYFDQMQMAGAMVKANYVWDKTRIDFISENIWGRGEILPLGFYTTDGRTIFELRGPTGGIMTSDIFYMVTGFQMFVNNPAACSYIDNLQIPPGYQS